MTKVGRVVVDGLAVEPVLGDPVLDAVALQVAGAVGRTVAVEAQRRAAPRRGFGETLFDLREVRGALAGGESGHCGRRRGVRDVGGHVEEHRRDLGHAGDARVELLLGVQGSHERGGAQLAELARDPGHVAPAQERVDAPGGPLALGDRLDHGLSAEHRIAAGEHPRVVGLERDVVDLDGLPLGALDALRRAGTVDYGELTDGGDHLVARDDELGALDVAGELELAEKVDRRDHAFGVVAVDAHRV